MTKKVNISSSSVLYIFTPPMSGVFMNVEMSKGDIKRCLMQGARVEEILKDGTTVRLNLKNYTKDFNKDIKEDIVEKVLSDPIDTSEQDIIVNVEPDLNESVEDVVESENNIDSENELGKNSTIHKDDTFIVYKEDDISEDVECEDEM